MSDDLQYKASTAVMPWDRPIPSFDELDGWRMCDLCGTTWKATLTGFDFAREWRAHVYWHMRDAL